MIKIDPKNKGKFTATKKKSGKTTAQLKHSKNALTRKRAVFAQNAKKWGKNRKKELSAKLDGLIAFDAPAVDSWNPIKRHRQHQDLKKWVQARPPGGGITAEQLEKQYPGHPNRTRHIIGGVIGTTAGAVGGVAIGAKLKSPKLARQLATAGSAIGGSAGIFASDPRHYIENIKGHNADWKHLKETFRNESVPVSGIKSKVPIATSHIQVARELKNQNVGFIKRHAAGLATFPVRHGTNAAFVPMGEKGLIVSGKKAPKIVIAHEGGHAKDYAHYGGEAGFKAAYPRYGQPSFDKRTYIENTLLPEHRAWKHANVRTKQDRKTRDAALRTYARGGMLLSELMDDLIEFGFNAERYATALNKPLLGKWTGGQLAGAALGVGSAIPTISAVNKYRKQKGDKATRWGAAKAGLTAPLFSEKLDKLIEFGVSSKEYITAESRLLKRAKELGMERQVRATALKQKLLRKRPSSYFPERGSISEGLSAKLDDLIQLGSDPRPRNGLGEFTGQQEGVADPTSMAKTYQDRAITTGTSIGSSLGAATVGGAGGAIGGGAVKSLGKALLEKIKNSRVRKS